jgi:hypothetical protein
MAVMNIEERKFVEKEWLHELTLSEITKNLNDRFATSYSHQAVRGSLVFMGHLKNGRETGVLWTEERMKMLSLLWSEGFTASQIADKLGGVTRSAVIGKAHRMNLQGRPSPIRTGGDSGCSRRRSSRMTQSRAEMGMISCNKVASAVHFTDIHPFERDWPKSIADPSFDIDQDFIEAA